MHDLKDFQNCNFKNYWIHGHELDHPMMVNVLRYVYQRSQYAVLESFNYWHVLAVNLYTAPYAPVCTSTSAVRIRW